jgi:hypothetical protein
MIPKGRITAINSSKMLIRASSGSHFELPPQPGLKQGDEVWLYFQHGRSLTSVELVTNADPDEIPPAELEAHDVHEWDLGELDTGE